MICKVKNTIDKYGLFSCVKSVAVGVSGGADSMCLLNILSKLKDEYGIILKAVHINHNLRGVEALRDENFVRDYCNNNGINLEVFSIDIRSLSDSSSLSEEECGRRERYRCFGSVGCDAVATAHTLSDSIETMLFNLARGTGLKGLCGIPVKREPNIIRPLIECTRQEIEEYCKDNNVPFITDSTNLTDDYTRNHIRHNLVPGLSVINKAYEKSILRCFNSLNEDEEYLHSETMKLIEACCIGEGYSADNLRNAPSALRKRAIAHILKDEMSKSIEGKHIDLINEAVLNSYGKIEIASDYYAEVKSGQLKFSFISSLSNEWKSPFVNGKAETQCGTFYLEKCDKNDPDAFDFDKIKYELFISSRLPGDRFTFKSRGVTKSLKKLFNEMKIPAEKRNAVPVLHDGENVVWIDGIGVNSLYKSGENTKNIMKIIKEGKNYD